MVECDSVATADYLYQTCDGVEFERSSTKLDLRFIPDSMEFKHEPRDVATEVYISFDLQTKYMVFESFVVVSCPVLSCFLKENIIQWHLFMLFLGLKPLV